MQRLAVHPDKHYLMTEDGQPFFYLGDTSWDMFQRLTADEIEYYFSIRAKQGFNVMQCVLFGGSEPTDWPNKYGRYSVKPPFDEMIFDTEGPYSYWDHVDFGIKCAEKYGIYIALLPMWNSKYNDHETSWFFKEGYEPGKKYGKFLGERYKDFDNVLWMLGGDVEVNQPHMIPMFQGLADGIKEGEGDRQHLITFHPGGLSTSMFQLKGDKDYIDFHSVQSGHSVHAYNPERFFDEMRVANKPFLDTEAHYEDHVANWAPNFRRWDGSDIREGAYQSVFAGACGETYGNPLIAFYIYEPLIQYKYDFYIGDMKEGGWMEAVRHEGAETLGYLKKLRLSRPYFELRPAPELVLNSDPDMLFGDLPAARGDNYAFIYSAYGREIQVDLEGKFDKAFIRASWFNPRTGEEKEICYMTPRKAVFVPETRGKGNDWVLVLDNFNSDWHEVSNLSAGVKEKE